MKSAKELEALNTDQENEKLVDKLPDWLARKWASKVRQIKLQKYRYLTFYEFSEFIMTEPILTRTTRLREQKGAKQHRKNALNNKQQRDSSHQTSECIKLSTQPMSKRQEFIKVNNLRFTCLTRVMATKLVRNHKPVANVYVSTRYSLAQKRILRSREKSQQRMEIICNQSVLSKQ